LDRHLLPGGVALYLIARDEIDGEVAGLGMAEVEAADRSGRPHGVSFGQADAGCLLDAEEVPERAFLGVVRAGGVAGGRADAAIFFVDQVLLGKVLTAAVAPVVAGALVE